MQFDSEWIQIETNEWALFPKNEAHCYPAYITEAYSFRFTNESGGELSMTHDFFETLDDCISYVKRLTGDDFRSLKDKWASFDGQRLDFVRVDNVWIAEDTGVDGVSCVIDVLYYCEFGPKGNGCWRKLICGIQHNIEDAKTRCEQWMFEHSGF